MFVNKVDTQNSFGLKIKSTRTKNCIQTVKDEQLQKVLQNAVDTFCKKTQEKGIRGGLQVISIDEQNRILNFNITWNVVDRNKAFRGESRFGKFTHHPVNKSVQSYQIKIDKSPDIKDDRGHTQEIVKRLFDAISDNN